MINEAYSAILYTTSLGDKSSPNGFPRYLMHFPIIIDQNQPINTYFKKILPGQLFYVLSSNKNKFFVWNIYSTDYYISNTKIIWNVK